MSLGLHVHNDIEEAAVWYKIPLVCWDSESVYILQEDRCVFVGSIQFAQLWLKEHTGKYCESKFPLK